GRLDQPRSRDGAHRGSFRYRARGRSRVRGHDARRAGLRGRAARIEAVRTGPLMASGAGERGGAAHVAADASNHHYDLPPRIFELFLDESLKYSVGLFERDDDTLEVAQQRKLERIARELRLGEGARVLDVGCGWGSLVGFLARRGCRVTGITPSPRQAEFVAARAAAAGLADRVS